MAGRPRTMSKRAKDFADRLHGLGDELFALMPDQYKKRENPRDPIHAAWQKAVLDLSDGWRAVKALCDLLAVKAGIAIEPVELDDGVNPSDPDQVGDSDIIVMDEESDTLAEWAVCYDIPIDVIRQRVREGADWELAITEPV